VQERTASKRLRLRELGYRKGLLMELGVVLPSLKHESLQSRRNFSVHDPRASVMVSESFSHAQGLY